MFQVGDFVQSKNGGPKLIIEAINQTELDCVMAGDPDKQVMKIDAAEVIAYSDKPEE
jgi:hypothetical protein